MGKTNYEKRIQTLITMYGEEYLAKLFNHIERSYDALFRLAGGQFHYFMDHMISESDRTRRFANDMQLANDKLGYDCVCVMAVLTHHCQLCAEDPHAWHTRAAFCKHKNRHEITLDPVPTGFFNGTRVGKIFNGGFENGATFNDDHSPSNIQFADLLDMVRDGLDLPDPKPYAVVVTKDQLKTIKAVAKPTPRGNDAFAKVFSTPVYETKKKLKMPKIVYSLEELKQYVPGGRLLLKKGGKK